MIDFSAAIEMLFPSCGKCLELTGKGPANVSIWYVNNTQQRFIPRIRFRVDNESEIIQKYLDFRTAVEV